jgi:microcystin-dependent protein
MGTPFLSEIRIVSWNFPPKGWAFCNGQFLPINQNQALFSLLGTTYGGNGQTTFALPDMRGRVPVHQGAGFTMGQSSGAEAVTLNASQMAGHTHPVTAGADAATVSLPTNARWGKPVVAAYGTPGDTAMDPACVTNVGGSQPHTNMQPYLVLNFCIALQGVFPSQN